MVTTTQPLRDKSGPKSRSSPAAERQSANGAANRTAQAIAFIRISETLQKEEVRL
jgi:hypothetical protein